MTEWRMLQLGSAMPRPCAAAITRAAQVLSAFVPTRVVPPSAGGLIHEAGSAQARSALLVEALSAGAVIVLVGGAGFNGMSLGEPMLAEILPFLPRVLEGTIIGAMAHAHVLSALAARYPGLRVLIGPPVAETIGACGDDVLAQAAARELVDLWKNGPLSHDLAAGEARVGCRFRKFGEPPEHPQVYAIRPRVLRAGRAAGPVIAGNLSALSIMAGGPDWPDASGAILFFESSEVRRRDIDRALRRLALLGILDRIGAVIAAVPIAEIATPLDPPVSAILEGVMGGSSYPVVVDAFVGTGAPALLLAAGRRVIVEAQAHGVSICWDST
jgi:hypothetical protein